MDDTVFQKYATEVQSWHKRGRLLFIESTLRRHVSPQQSLSILEVGAGVGQNVAVLRTFGEVDVAEIHPHGLSELQKRGDLRRVLNTAVPFPVQPEYDLLCAFDVIEHLADDDRAIRWAIDALNPGGLLFVLVPSYQWLFSDHDVALHHMRRYSRRQLVELVGRHAEIVSSGYFVSTLLPVAVLSRLRSILSYRLRGKNAPVPPTCVKQSGTCAPFLDSLFGKILQAEVKLMTRGLTLPFGLSTFVVARNARAAS